jgi:hypothetical protein
MKPKRAKQGRPALVVVGRQAAPVADGAAPDDVEGFLNDATVLDARFLDAHTELRAIAPLEEQPRGPQGHSDSPPPAADTASPSVSEPAAVVSASASPALVEDVPLAPPAAAATPSTKKDTPSAPDEELWPASPPQRKRELPRWLVGTGLVVVALVVLTLLCAHAAHAPVAATNDSEGASEGLPQELVVNEKDLKHRIQVTADYFRSRRSLSGAEGAQPPADVGGGSVQAPPLDDAELTPDEQQRRRANDPEDLIAHRHPFAGGASRRERGGDADHGGDTRDGESSATTADAADHTATSYRRPFLYYPSQSAAQAAGGAAGTPSSPGGATIAPAGAIVPVVLSTPINLPLSGGNASIVAAVDNDTVVPKGSRLIGTASPDESGRLSVHFTRLLLPDNREAKLDAEAQDESGAFGVNGAVDANRSARAQGVAGDVAADTASSGADALLSTFTGGIAGDLVRNATSRATSHRSSSTDDSSTAARVRLAAGAHFTVFLHEAAVERR